MRHIWEKYIELAEDYRHTPEYSDIYKLITLSEGVICSFKNRTVLI